MPVRLAVFCGPSLPPPDRRAFGEVIFLPPAARGDVEAAAQAYEALLLIDGVFHHALAPSPKECCRAAGRARAFGAASMGAMRAAECAAYGFRPLGAIAGWYASGKIDGDDEVAVLCDPATQRALTVPSVNVRYVAWLARRRGILSLEEEARLVDESRAVFYMDRRWDDVVALVPAHARAAVAAISRTNGDLKRLDARFALRAMQRLFARDGVPA
jgi:TfuA protein